jgi:hypothetical protein
MMNIMDVPLQGDVNDELGLLVQQRLQDSNYRSLQRITCEVRPGRLRLRGRIPAYLFEQVNDVVLEALHDASAVANQ